MSEPLNPDWSMLEATRDSLREHQAMLQQYRRRLSDVQRDRDALAEKIARLERLCESDCFVCKSMKEQTK